MKLTANIGSSLTLNSSITLDSMLVSSDAFVNVGGNITLAAAVFLTPLEIDTDVSTTLELSASVPLAAMLLSSSAALTSTAQSIPPSLNHPTTQGLLTPKIEVTETVGINGSTIKVYETGQGSPIFTGTFINDEFQIFTLPAVLDGSHGYEVTATQGSDAESVRVPTTITIDDAAGITATITGPASVGDTSGFAATLQFSAAQPGFSPNPHIVVGNGILQSSSGSGTTWNLTIIPDGLGDITIDLPVDVAEYGNTAASETVTFSAAATPIITLSNAVITSWNGTTGDISIDFNTSGSTEDIVPADIKITDSTGQPILGPVPLVSTGTTGAITFQYNDTQDWIVSVAADSVFSGGTGNLESNPVTLDHEEATTTQDLTVPLTGEVGEVWSPGNAFFDILTENNNEVYGHDFAGTQTYKLQDFNVAAFAGDTLTYLYKFWTTGLSETAKFSITWFDNLDVQIGSIDVVYNATTAETFDAPASNYPNGGTLTIPANAVTMNIDLRLENEFLRFDDIRLQIAGAGTATLEAIVGGTSITAPPVFTHPAIQATSTPTFTGTAEAGQTITIYTAGTSTVLATGTVQLDNTFSILMPSFADGLHNFDGTATGVNGESVITPTSVTIDTVSPSVSILGAPGSVNDNSTFQITAQFSDPMTGFDITDISASNALRSGFVAVDGDTYTMNVTPTGNGDIAINIAAGVAIDGASNGNTAAAQVIVVHNNPSVSDPNMTTNRVHADYIRSRNNAASSITLKGANVNLVEISSISVVSNPAIGTLSISGLDVTFTPNSGQYGLDTTGEIQVSWANGRSMNAKIYVTNEEIVQTLHYAATAQGSGDGSTSGNAKAFTAWEADVEAHAGGLEGLLDYNGGTAYDIRLALGNISGSHAKPNTLKGEGGGIPLIRYSGSNETVFLSKNIGYLWLEDLAIDKTSGPTVLAFNNPGESVNVGFDNVDITGGGNGINWQAKYGSNVTIINCNVHDNIDNGWNGRPASLIILNCEFVRNADSQSYSGGPLQWCIYASHIDFVHVEGNLITDGEGLMKLRDLNNFTYKNNTLKRGWAIGMSAGGDLQSGVQEKLENGEISYNLMDFSQNSFAFSDADSNIGGGIHNVDVHHNAIMRGHTRSVLSRQSSISILNDAGDVNSNFRVFENIFWSHETNGNTGTRFSHNDVEYFNNIVGGGHPSIASADLVLRLDGVSPNIHDNELLKLFGSTDYGVPLTNGNTALPARPQVVSDILDTL